MDRIIIDAGTPILARDIGTKVAPHLADVASKGWCTIAYDRTIAVLTLSAIKAGVGEALVGNGAGVTNPADRTVTGELIDAVDTCSAILTWVG